MQSSYCHTNIPPTTEQSKERRNYYLLFLFVILQYSLCFNARFFRYVCVCVKFYEHWHYHTLKYLWEKITCMHFRSLFMNLINFTIFDCSHSRRSMGTIPFAGHCFIDGILAWNSVYNEMETGFNDERIPRIIISGEVTQLKLAINCWWSLDLRPLIMPI